MKYKVESPDKGVYSFRFKDKFPSGKKIKILVCSDIHIDSKECDREILKRHCQEADYIRIVGDLFDLMQGRNDKRRSYGDLKESYKASNYVDEVVKDAALFFKPFAKKLQLVTLGNHETSVILNLGTNPLSAFCFMMRTFGSDVIEGSYQGFIKDAFEDTNKRIKGSVITAFHHGHGGSAQKTEGMLEMEGDKAKFPNADIVVKGHNHFKWHNPGQNRYWLNDSLKVETKVQHHVRLGTYKRPKFTDGWEIEKGFKPTPLGGYFLTYTAKAPHSNKVISFDIQDAS